METKKSLKANIENKKTLFLEMGLVMALFICLVAFEWKTYEKTISLMDLTTLTAIEDEIVPITLPEPPSPPEIPEAPIVSDIIQIVENDVNIVDTPIWSIEDNKTGVDILIYVPKEAVDAPDDDEEIPAPLVEQEPDFMGGGVREFTRWVGRNLDYPDIAKQNNVQGRVIIEFVVTAEGHVTNVRVLRGVDSSLDREAVRVISMSPKWTPGKHRGKPVRVKYVFPVVFQLR